MSNVYESRRLLETRTWSSTWDGVERQATVIDSLIHESFSQYLPENFFPLGTPRSTIVPSVQSPRTPRHPLRAVSTSSKTVMNLDLSAIE